MDNRDELTRSLERLGAGTADIMQMTLLCGRGCTRFEVRSGPDHPDPAVSLFYGLSGSTEASLIYRPDEAQLIAFRAGQISIEQLDWIGATRHGRDTSAKNLSEFEKHIETVKKHKILLLQELQSVAFDQKDVSSCMPKWKLNKQERTFFDLLCALLNIPDLYEFTCSPPEIIDADTGELHVGLYGPNADDGRPSVSIYISRDSAEKMYEIHTHHEDGGLFRDLREIVGWLAQAREA